LSIVHLAGQGARLQDPTVGGAESEHCVSDTARILWSVISWTHWICLTCWPPPHDAEHGPNARGFHLAIHELFNCNFKLLLLS